MGVHTLLLGLFCPMELHHSWFLSEFFFFFIFTLQPQVVKCCRLTHSVILRRVRLLKRKEQNSFSFRPGNLKRGMTSVVDESTMKRSRTSSISSVSGAHAPRGTPGTARNPIHSSYSSSGGISQVKLSVPTLSSAAPAEPKKTHELHSCVSLYSSGNALHPAQVCPVLGRLVHRLQRQPQKNPGQRFVFPAGTNQTKEPQTHL